LLKLLDRMVGGMASAILPAPALGTLGAPRRILLIRPGGIGDAVLLIPAILALKETFPRAKISLLAEKRNGAAFALCPAIDQLLLYDAPGGLFRALRGGFDLVIDTEQWHRLSAVVARLVRAPVSIGFATNERRRLFSHAIGYSHDDYEALSFFNLLAPLGIEAPAAWELPFLSVPAPAAARAEALIAPLSGTRFVALFPGASIPERRWGAERFATVAERLARIGVPVVVVGGRDDVVEGELVARKGGGLNLAGVTTLAETAAVIARSALLLSGDSGVLHIAVGLGIPTMSLFGPGIEAKWGPKGAGDTVLNKRLPCSPCTRFGTTPSCPCQARCLSEIKVAEVAAAVEESLGRENA
jgi:ADP-heptose:LPS heptosyltransferase